MKHLFTVLLLSTFTLCKTYAQSSSLNKTGNHVKTAVAVDIGLFQSQLQAVIDKVYPACVRVITNEKLTPTGGVSASGVCVSRDGIIMTAGHLTVPGGKYEIVFPDGTQVNATGLGKIGRLDVGLLKVTDEGRFPFANLGYSSMLEIGVPCFSIAYPGSFLDKAVARIGSVVGKHVGQFGSLQTTCLMEPGDSGGPVFDMDGTVIGIRSYIGMPLEENFEVPADYYRKYWNAVLKPINYHQIPEEDSLKGKDVCRIYTGPSWHQIQSAIRKAGAAMGHNTVVVKNAESAKTILGTVINPEGIISDKKLLNGRLIVSKSSEVDSDPIIMMAGKTFPAKILFRDPDRDLVLLQANFKSKESIRLSNIVSRGAGKGYGTILISPIPGDSGTISIFGPSGIELPAVYNVGYLGVKLELKEGKNIITHVQPGTAAAQSGLSEGDEILQINNVGVDSPSDFINELKNKRPGEIISLQRSVEGKIDTLNIVLQSRPFKGYGHIAEQFKDGRSEIRDGFNNIFIHDAALKPSECGGPVFDVNGKFVGINLARYSRTSSIALPAEEVVKFLQMVATAAK